MEHLPGFIHTLSPFVHKHGYLGIGLFVFLEDFGVPVPGETILLTGAVFAGLHELNIFLVVLTGFIAAILGDNIGFSIGKYGGHPLVERLGKYIFLTPKRIKAAEDFFRKKGGWIVIIARFIEGLRQANGIIAGLAEMSWLRFLSYNAVGAALWSSLWCIIGYYSGSHINTILKYDLYVSIAAVIGVIGYLTYRFVVKPKLERKAA
jgi:membrane protein DedA with SNARE-associated domain